LIRFKAVEQKRVANDAHPSSERDPAALVAAIRNAALQLEQTLRAVENRVERVWGTARSVRG